MQSSLVSAGVLLLAPCLPASAQDPAKLAQEILGRGNAVFARRLLEEGYLELAEGVCRAVESSGKADAAELIGIKALSIELRQAAARREFDLERRKQRIYELLKEANAFVDEHESTREAQLVRNSLPELILLLGETLATMMQKEEDPALYSELRKEGERNFLDAEQALSGRAKDLKKELEDPAIEDIEPIENQHILALYSLGRTYYFHSLLYLPQDISKNLFLEKALGAFREFDLTYSDQLLAYEVLIYRGLCNKTLGNVEDALADFDDAVALRESWEKGPDGRYPVHETAADIVSAAVLQKMLLQIETKDFAGADRAAKEFFDSIPDPLRAAQGLAVLAAQADAQLAAGDGAAASATAQKLVDADPKGRWGARGRELQGQALSSEDVGLEADAMFKVAEALATQGRYDRALEVLRRTRAAARGKPSEADIGADSYLLAGSIYARRGQLHEASLACDLAAEEYPRAQKAPDALYRALNFYIELYSQEHQRPYKDLADQRAQQLARDYPTHPFALKAKITEGKKLEAEQRFLDAARVYEQIPKGSPDYLEALYRAGNSYILQGRALIKAQKTSEALPHFAKAETALTEAAQGLEAGLEGTIDRDVQARLGGLAFGARSSLVEMLLTPGLGREKDAFPVLEAIDAKYAWDEEKIGIAWGFRIRALQALGKFDDARAQLEVLRQKDPKSRGIPPAGAVLARALDTRAAELFAKDPKSTQAEDLWRQATTYYLLSVSQQLDGTSTARAGELEDVAERLYAMGLHFNGVPEGRDTFIGWDPDKTTHPQQLEKAAEIFEKALTVAPSYRNEILLGRIYGFLGRWLDSARVFGRIFDREPLLDTQGERFRSDVIGAKPELISAYLEWGIAEHEAGLEANDRDRLARAKTIFSTMALNTPVETQSWWHARYHQTRGMADRGEYEEAKALLRTIERTTNDFDQGKFGYKERFLELKNELSRK